MLVHVSGLFRGSVKVEMILFLPQFQLSEGQENHDTLVIYEKSTLYTLKLVC